MRSGYPPEDIIMKAGPDPKDSVKDPLKAPIAPPNLVVLSGARAEAVPAKPQSLCARQRLEDQFRQRFLEQHADKDLATALSIGAEPAATVNGRTS
jgi:hypothetical protein